MPGLRIDEISRRLAAAKPRGRRTSEDAVLPGVLPRGDHDLNPDFYDPAQSLVSAAVLVPIVERPEGLTLLLTRRTDHLDVHAGQISFPGGRVEGDEGLEEAALRETEEEVGLPRHYVRAIGWLDTYITRTGFEIAPMVGAIKPPFPVVPDSFEVAEVFEVPLDYFLSAENLKKDARIYQGKRRHFFAFSYRDHYIWGATAGMLVNLVEVLTAAKYRAASS
jgi:8-oxo-dGTP pyrophosphatase MutT (NUDIX family)